MAIPGKALGKLSSVRAQLELLALRKDRLLAALWVDGIAINLQQTISEWERFERVEAKTISFGELGVNMIATVRREATQNLDRIRYAGAQVLINPWDGSYRLAQRLMAELRTLFLVIGFIEELCGDHATLTRIDAGKLREHIASIEQMTAGLQDAARGENVEDLSDFLLVQLVPWVEALVTLLEPKYD